MEKAELKKKIEQILDDSIETDYAWSDEGEYPVESFNKRFAVSKLLELWENRNAVK